MRCFCIAIHIFIIICVLVTSPSSSLALNGFFDESTPPLPPRSTTHYPTFASHTLFAPYAHASLQVSRGAQRQLRQRLF